MIASAADRLADLLREAAGGLDREAAHALLDAALDLAAVAADAEGQEGRLAQAAAITLSRGIAGWTVPVQRSPEEWDQLAEDDPSQWREDAARCIRAGYGVVPQAVLDALMFGLTAINDHQPMPGIYTPAPRPSGYGSNPDSRRRLEQALHAWAAMMIARGEKAAGLRQRVADAAGVTVPAFTRWLSEWRERDLAHATRVLAAARALGKGATLTEPVPDELLLIRVVPMEALAASWNAAKAPG